MKIQTHKTKALILPHPARMNFDADYAQKLLLTEIHDELLKSTSYTMAEVVHAYSADRRTIGIHNTRKTNDEIASRLSYPKFYLQNGACFSTTDELNQELMDSVCANNVLAEFIRLPFTASYFEFGTNRNTGLFIYNEATAWHHLEGAYVFEVTRESHRVIEIVLIGSPLGKAHILDDAIETINLYIDDENLSLNALLENTFKELIMKNASLIHMTDERIKAIKDSVNLLIKTILYLNSLNSIKRNSFELTDSLKKLKCLSSKKAAKRMRAQKYFSDKIILGPQNAYTSRLTMPFGQMMNAKRPHRRRGHFRNVNGILKYILPVIVRKDLLERNEIPPRPKDYAIKNK